MGTVKAMLGDLMGRLLFHEVTVTEARQVSPHFRRLTLAGDGLRGAPWSAGDKLQVLLADAEMRTYTPFAFDAQRGSLELLVYSHGDSSPGARWGRAAAPGDRARVFGPRGSLPLASMKRPVVLFGDETSFAVARALLAARGDGEDVRCVFEVTSPDESQGVLRELGLSGCVLVERRGDGEHLAAAADGVARALTAVGAASLVLTGRAQSIQVLRGKLRERHAALPAQKAKAYWSVGRKGLD